VLLTMSENNHTYLTQPEIRAGPAAGKTSQGPNAVRGLTTVCSSALTRSVCVLGGGCYGDSNTPVVLTTRLPADWAELVEGERERERERETQRE